MLIIGKPSIDESKRRQRYWRNLLLFSYRTLETQWDTRDRRLRSEFYSSERRSDILEVFFLCQKIE